MKRSIQLLTLLAGTLVATAAMAQADLGLKGIGGAFGYVSPDNVDGTFSIGALADMGTVAPKVKLETRLDFWSHSQSDFGAKASIHDVTLGGRIKYMLDVKDPKFQPYVGTGLGLHFVHTEVTVPAQAGVPAMSAGDSQTKLGLDIGGGVSTPVSPRMDLMGEVWYGIVSDLSQFSLRFGLCHRL
jgi:opacity protein-like surface antigen